MKPFTELKSNIGEEFYNAIQDSLNTFFERDNFLVKHWIHEQSISHKIAYYLNSYDFGGLDVDVEYNKSWKDPKKFKNIMESYKPWDYKIIGKNWNTIDNFWRLFKEKDKLALVVYEEWNSTVIWKIDWKNKILIKSWSIRPDIIIHKRWGNENNFCVFEIKKSKLSDEDKIKLEWFTDSNFNYGYKFWFGISNFKDKSCNISFYHEGKFIKEFVYLSK